MRATNEREPVSSYSASPAHGAPAYPALVQLSGLLKWDAVPFRVVTWRDAFENLLEKRLNYLLGLSEADSCNLQGLALLPLESRKRFMRAPVVSALVLRRHADGRRAEGGFDGQYFAELLAAELASEGVFAELPASYWTARGDRFLDRSARDDWKRPTTLLGGIGIAIDESSPFPFPDDEPGIGATSTHNHAELELVQKRLQDATELLRRSCPLAMDVVGTFVEVLALRREAENARKFYSSTFWGYAGLVRLANAHLLDADLGAVTEALVHEAIHCILHVHEELETPFLRTVEARQAKIVSPWTGVTIKLQSYIHACAVWYGLYWLWAKIEPTDGLPERRIRMLRHRAREGFEHGPVAVGLRHVDHLLNADVRHLLQNLEQQMLFEVDHGLD